MLTVMGMPMVLQGRVVTAADLDQIRTLQAMHPGWSRRQLSGALATAWDWRTAAGRLKDMAARTLLLKLERAGHIQLPPGSGLRRTGCEIAACRSWNMRPIRSGARCAICVRSA